MRLQEQQIDESVLAYVSAQPRFVTSILNAEEDDIPLMGFPMSIAFGFLLFYLTMISGSMLLQSAVQEKRDRMSEVVLSSIGADTLMTGKIVGHFVLGALQIIFWLAIGLPIAHFVMELPLGDFIVPQLLPQLFLFTMLGYLFYAALFVGIGATMEDIQSASNSQGMVFMLPMLSFRRRADFQQSGRYHRQNSRHFSGDVADHHHIAYRCGSYRNVGSRGRRCDYAREHVARH